MKSGVVEIVRDDRIGKPTGLRIRVLGGHCDCGEVGQENSPKHKRESLTPLLMPMPRREIRVLVGFHGITIRTETAKIQDHGTVVEVFD